MSQYIRGETISKARILIIENDQVLAHRVAVALADEGYKTTITGDTLSGLKNTYEVYPDLIIMDRDLPMVSLEDTCAQVCQFHYIPIIVLGNQGSASRILELGADAYMNKPPDLKELVARVKSLLRRIGQNGSSGSNIGPEDKETQKKVENASNKLTSTEFRLASCLMLNKDRLLDHFCLINEMWGGKKITVNTLHSYMRRLQQKLVTGSISMFRGVGYYFSDVH